jgi:hypothetical protein
VRPSTRHIGAVVLAACGGSFVIGQMTAAPTAKASATRVYTLHVGDKVTIPAIRQVCSVSTEGGAANLFCARQRNAKHQVTIFRDNILVWKVGNPDRPAWSGKP